MKLTQVQRRKLDFDPLEQKAKYLPVFIRFSDQLLRRASDYDGFCEDHVLVPRSRLRGQILRRLQQKADRSWQRVGALVEDLRDRKDVRSVKRFWIVNGFSCDATLEACAALAKQRSVEYIYLQPPGLQHQHRDKRQKFDRVRAKKIMTRTLKTWRDDSDDAFSAKGLTIPWNVKRIQADQVWKKEGLTGRGVVVGVIDSGMYPVRSLTAALWRNSGEIFNGRDDTKNGYVDDVFGYNFSTRAFNVFNIGGQDHHPHGSMCAGIIAGRPHNDLNMQTGVAPRSRLMVLKGGGGRLEAYEYAVAHGADIVSMSYMFVHKPSFPWLACARKLLGDLYSGTMPYAFTVLTLLQSLKRKAQTRPGHQKKRQSPGSGG